MATLMGTAIQNTSQNAVTMTLSGVLWAPKRPPRIRTTATRNISQPGQLGTWGTGGTSSPAAEFLDDRDRPEQDDERQDAPEREVAAEHAEDALPGRGGTGRCGRRVLAESRCVDAGVRVAAWSAQGGQRPPTTAVVVLDLL